ncbi:MAG: ABC transporter permease [Oscillospiraceae bacterium]
MEKNKQMSPTAKKMKQLLFSYNSVLIFVLLLIIGSFFVNKFTRNYSTIIFESSIYGFIAIGLALVMITGNIDLSVGFQAATAAVVVILTCNATGSLVAAVIAALVCGALMGALNGIAVTSFGINPLIATIASNYIYKGVVYFFTKDGSIYPEGELRAALKNSIAKLSFFDTKVLTLTVIIFVVILALLYFIMRKTNFGNNLYITGDNAEAGKLAGINVKRVSFLAYVLCGISCGVAGLFLASNQGAAIYTLGEGRDVFAISACVIGGIKMAGGKGTMLNVLLGILIMRMISTAMNLLLIPSAWVDFVSGVLLIVVLFIDKLTSVKAK